MAVSTRSLIETQSSSRNLRIAVKISRLVQKPLKERTDQHVDKIANSNVGLDTVSKSWRDKNRLYPPFRQRKRDALVEKDDREKEMHEESVSKLRKYRFSVCIRKKQFPITSANVPLVCNKNPPEPGGSDFLYLSSECGGDNGIPSTCGLHGAPCIEPICAHQDNEPCDITRGVDRADDVCPEVLSAQDDKSDDVTVAGDKPDSNNYTTGSDESIDYVICESIRRSTSSAFEDETFYEEQEYFDIHDKEYEIRDSTSKHESKSELVLKSELFQDPLVSHRLTIPYEEIPPSRYCVGGAFDDSLKTKFLTKRPQSPVRDIPEGRFDVHAGIAEVTRRAEIHNAKYALRKSEDFMARMITSDPMSSPRTSTSAGLLTTFLKVLLDDVRLSLTVGESENDLSLTLATIWAITEFVMTETGLEVKHSVTIANLGAVPKLNRPVSHNLTLLEANSFRQTSNISYPPRGSNCSDSLHQALPWAYLCAAHAEGLPKNYPTVRNRIDEVTDDNGVKKPRTAYLSDITCSHFKDMSFSDSALPENQSEQLGPNSRND